MGMELRQKSETVRTDDGECGRATEWSLFLNCCHLHAIIAFPMPRFIVIHQPVCMYCKLFQYEEVGRIDNNDGRLLMSLPRNPLMDHV